MTCDTAHDRFLSHPTKSRPDGELTAHLAGCPACTAVATRVRSLDASIAALPFVDSTPRKAAFVASLMTGTTVRTAPRPWGKFLRQPHVRSAIALAACVLIAVGTYSFWPRGKDAHVEFVASKHEFLGRTVSFAVDQAKQPSASKRMQSSSDYAGQILAEIRGVYLAVSPDDTETVRSLSDLFVKTLREGVVASAEGPPGQSQLERKAALDPLMPALAGYAQAARELTTTAPEHVKPALAKIEAASTATAIHLTTLGAATASPGPIPVAAGTDAGREWKSAKANRAVIELIASRALKAGAAADAVDRADEIRAAAADLETALAQAVSAGDAERAAECGEHLAKVLVEGVKPAVDAASEGENVNSPSYARIVALKERAKGDAQRATVALPVKGRLADHPKIISTRKLLDEAAKRIL